MEFSIKLPETLQQAIIYFANPDNCLKFLIPLRWPNGISCPRCGSADHSFLSTRRVWKCKGCKKQFSIKVGTIMEDSPLGLDKWMCGIWMIANAKNGISSYEIHRALGITQKSAWFLLHRIRLAMQSGTFAKMSGTVEIDETYIGGKARNMHKKERDAKIKGRGGVGKAVVMGLLERGKKGRPSQVKATVITDTSKETMQREVRNTVRKGSRINTDTHKSYEGLSEDYIHEAVCHDADEYVRGSVYVNGLENFWALFKRCIKGTYVSCEPFHLFRYVDEEAFRFNERDKNDLGRFIKVTKSVSGRRLTYRKLTGEE